MSCTTSSPTCHKVHQQLTKVFLAAENTHNYEGMCPGDAQCHTPPTYLGAPSQLEPSTTLLNPFYTKQCEY